VLDDSIGLGAINRDFSSLGEDAHVLFIEGMLGVRILDVNQETLNVVHATVPFGYDVFFLAM